MWLSTRPISTRRLAGCVLAAVCSLHAAPARAEVVPTTATLSIGVKEDPPLSFSNAGSVTIVGGVVTVPAGLVQLTGELTVPVSSVTAVHSLRARNVSNLAATFRAGGVTTQAPGEICPGIGNNPFGVACNVGGGVGGRMGLTGTLVFVITPMAVTIPVNLNAALLGQGGSTNLPFEIDAAAWSTGWGLIQTANDTFTADWGTLGPLTLVTPTFVGIAGAAVPLVSSFRLTGVIVPEPSSIALIATGVAGLLLLRGRGGD